MLRLCRLTKPRGSGVSEAREVATEQARDGESVGNEAAEERGGEDV